MKKKRKKSTYSARRFGYARFVNVLQIFGMWLLTANVEKNEKEKTAIVGEKEREEMKLRSKQLYELGKEIENETEKKYKVLAKRKNK